MTSRRFRFSLARRGTALVLFAILLVLLALTGGYSRYDTSALAVLRPLAIVVAAALLLLPPGELKTASRGPALMLVGLAVIVGIQLVPLPPAAWTLLPERAGYKQAAEWIGGPQPWRPLTIVPVLTWNSLLALLPPAATMIAFSRLDQKELKPLVGALLLLGVASALLGVIQIGTGAGYLYRNFSAGLPTGFFSNRNHQAAFLASLLPALAIWTAYPRRGMPLAARRIAGGAGATLFVVTILITGSRTGLLLTTLDLAAAGWLVLRAPSSGGRRIALPLATLGLVLALLIGVAVYLGRGGGISRFASLDGGAEMRVRAWPVLRDLLTTYLPWGSGFGTFDPLFRMYEPDALLKPSFFNNAHNDLVELAITGGAPALILLGVLLIWIARGWMAAARAWRYRGASHATSLPIAGGVMAITWLFASLSDYPLRTPLAGALFVLSCCLLATAGSPRETRRL